MKGAYLLIMEVKKKVSVKTKGKEFLIEPGYYVYVGSAMNSLEARVRRHMRKEKKLHWHIDYLLKSARILEAILIPSEIRLEEELSKAVGRYGEAVKGFGASDLRIESNLYRFERNPRGLLEGILSDMGLDWKTVKSEDEI